MSGMMHAPCDLIMVAIQVHIGWLEDGTAVFAFRGTATMQDGKCSQHSPIQSLLASSPEPPISTGRGHVAPNAQQHDSTSCQIPVMLARLLTARGKLS